MTIITEKFDSYDSKNTKNQENNIKEESDAFEIQSKEFHQELKDYLEKDSLSNELLASLLTYPLNRSSNYFGCKYDGHPHFLDDRSDIQGYYVKGFCYLITNSFYFQLKKPFDQGKIHGEYIQWTSLQHFLFPEPNLKVIELLLSFGANLNTSDITGKVFEIPKDLNVYFSPLKFLNFNKIKRMKGDVFLHFM